MTRTRRAGEQGAGTARYNTSIYLDEASQERLVELEDAWQMSRSQVVRTLIQNADREKRDERLTALALEMSTLLAIR